MTTLPHKTGWEGKNQDHHHHIVSQDLVRQFFIVTLGNEANKNIEKKKDPINE